MKIKRCVKPLAKKPRANFYIEKTEKIFET